jgi:hypothetical protein
MPSHRPLIAMFALCGALATGASLAQTPPTTPSSPHPVENAIPPATSPTMQPPMAHSPALPAAPSTAGAVPQRPELQRQQQQLRNGVKSTTDEGMHPRAGETHTGSMSPTQPASASSIH